MRAWGEGGLDRGRVLMVARYEEVKRRKGEMGFNLREELNGWGGSMKKIFLGKKGDMPIRFIREDRLYSVYIGRGGG